MHAIVLVHKMQRMALLTSNSNNSSPVVKNAPAANDALKDQQQPQQQQDRQLPPKLPPRNTGGSMDGAGGAGGEAGETGAGAGGQRAGESKKEAAQGLNSSTSDPS